VPDLLLPTREYLRANPQECWDARRERDDRIRRLESFRSLYRDLGWHGLTQRGWERAKRAHAGRHPFQWRDELGLPVFVVAGGAFPTNGVIETFTGADSTSPPNGNWTNTIGSAVMTGSLQILSNQAASVAATGCAYWNAAKFGPDCEVYVTMGTKPGGTSSAMVTYRITNEGTANVDGYGLFTPVTAGNDLQLDSITNEAFTAVGANYTQTVTAGDSYGVMVVGTIHTPEYKVGAGAWSALATRNDATWNVSGRIGLYDESTTTRQDDFGGGTLVTATLTYHPRGVRRRKGPTNLPRGFPPHRANPPLVVVAVTEEPHLTSVGSGS
jgi:hypothetical protein